MITKIGAALVSSAVKPAKYQQIQPVQQIEKKPITPTTQTQDVANNIRGLSQGYDSREGFNRPNQNATSGNDTRNNSMITKIGNYIFSDGQADPNYQMSGARRFTTNALGAAGGALTGGLLGGLTRMNMPNLGGAKGKALQWGLRGLGGLIGYGATNAQNNKIQRERQLGLRDGTLFGGW